MRTWIQADDEPETLDGFVRVPRSHAPEPFPPAAIDPAATIAVFHTSGTSGFPKGAALSSNALLGARASTVLAGLFLGPSDLALIALPWSHIMAVSIALYGLMAGIRGCFLDHFDVARALDLIERHRVTAFVGVPAMFARLVNSNPDPARLKSVRLWLSASDHLPAEVRQRLRQFGALLRLPGGRRIPPVLLNGYGMVELGGLAMMGIELSFIPGSGDLCFPVPPFRIRVVDENGRRVPAGATGECQIRRRGLAPHYWKDKGDSQGLAYQRRLAAHRRPGHAQPPRPDPSGGAHERCDQVGRLLGLRPRTGRGRDGSSGRGARRRLRPAPQGEGRDSRGGGRIARWLPGQRKRACWTGAGRILRPTKRRAASGFSKPASLPQNHNGKMLRRVLRERFSQEMD